jgi:hypothetical protein
MLILVPVFRLPPQAGTLATIMPKLRSRLSLVMASRKQRMRQKSASLAPEQGICPGRRQFAPISHKINDFLPNRFRNFPCFPSFVPFVAGFRRGVVETMDGIS